jgi:hypothetical protein
MHLHLHRQSHLCIMIHIHGTKFRGLVAHSHCCCSYVPLLGLKNLATKQQASDSCCCCCLLLRRSYRARLRSTASSELLLLRGALASPSPGHQQQQLLPAGGAFCSHFLNGRCSRTMPGRALRSLIPSSQFPRAKPSASRWALFCLIGHDNGSRRESRPD